jgi:curved DNA-binding protein CbpA
MTEAEALSILALSPRYTMDQLKAAYRRAAKESHPDLVFTSESASASAFESRVAEGEAGHLRMIEVNQAYNLLRSALARASAGQGEAALANRSPPLRPGTAAQPKADYQVYKRGVELFDRIHPSAWVQVGKAGLFDPNALREKQREADAFRQALAWIAQAYRLFSELIADYPDSIWVADAEDRLKSLEKMLILYKKMAANYGDPP